MPTELVGILASLRANLDDCQATLEGLEGKLANPGSNKQGDEAAEIELTNGRYPVIETTCPVATLGPPTLQCRQFICKVFSTFR